MPEVRSEERRKGGSQWIDVACQRQVPRADRLLHSPRQSQCKTDREYLRPMRPALPRSRPSVGSCRRGSQQAVQPRTSPIEDPPRPGFGVPAQHRGSRGSVPGSPPPHAWDNACQSDERLDAGGRSPSRIASRNSGNLARIPPRNRDFVSAAPAAAKWPAWLKMKFEMDARSVAPMPAVCAASVIFNSMAFAQTGS